MDSAELQNLLQNSSGTGTPNTSKLFESALEPIMPLLSLFFVISVVLTVVIVLYFIINIVQKQRQHKAILRIDKNLQRLVDAQLPVEKPAQKESTQLAEAE